MLWGILREIQNFATFDDPSRTVNAFIRLPAYKAIRLAHHLWNHVNRKLLCYANLLHIQHRVHVGA